ncbi:MAG: glycosyltransferase family 4 protein [Thermoanaerobacterales bacterium]|nr:glycosyltransferase family 4 protein [Thermoanaerobacterales bacterium]
MNILYYDLLRGRNTSTASNHVNEIIRNLEKLGNTILLRDNNVQKEEGLEKPPNSSLNLWGKIGTRWPIMGIFLSLVGEIRVFIRGIIALIKINVKPDIVYYRHGLFNAGLWTAKLLRIPAVKEVNGIVANEKEVTNQAKGIILNIINHIEKRNMPKADKIIVVTSKLKQILIREYNVSENKIEVLENGANVDLFRPMERNRVISKLRISEQFRYVCFVGNFATWQGLEYLIKSVPHVLKECPDARFLLVGDGDLKERLESMVKDIGVSDKVIFTGMVPYQNVPYYINASDVCVAPFISQRNERIGLSPLKLCEYLSCEKPVIASRISGLEILEEHQMGLLVPPEDEVALAQAIVRMLKDYSLREEMGKNGRQYVVKHRSWENVARKTLQVFEELMGQNSGL